MPLFDTISEQVELGPATLLDSGNTASSGNSGYTVKGTDESWHLFVRKGDYIFLGGTVNDGAIITEVIDTETLKIAKPIAKNSTPFTIYRPNELSIRPPLGVEWEIHTIVITPRIDAGESYNLHNFPVEIWSTNDNKPKTLLFTTQNYPLALDTSGGLPAKPQLRYILKIQEMGITIKPTYMSWLLIRNYHPVRVDVFVNGIEKTVEREEG